MNYNACTTTTKVSPFWSATTEKENMIDWDIFFKKKSQENLPSKMINWQAFRSPVDDCILSPGPGPPKLLDKAQKRVSCVQREWKTSYVNLQHDKSKFHKDLEQQKRGHTACTDRKLYLSRLPCASDRRDFATNSIRFISDSTLSFFQLWKSIRISGQPSNNNCLTHTFSKGSWSYRKYKPIFQWVILCGLRRIHVKIHWEL